MRGGANEMRRGTLTAILEVQETEQAMRPQPRGCGAVCAPRAASGCPMNPGGEWCPSDQRIVDQCPEC